MKTVFADTSFYVAALNPRDALHTRAEVVGRGFRGRVITTEYILLEVATFHASVALRPVFVSLLRTLQIDPGVTVLPASSELWVAGVDLFVARHDKEWSLTDCISFVVMTERGLTDALTADHHFEQAGFVALLK